MITSCGSSTKRRRPERRRTSAVEPLAFLTQPLASARSASCTCRSARVSAVLGALRRSARAVASVASALGSSSSNSASRASRRVSAADGFATVGRDARGSLRASSAPGRRRRVTQRVAEGREPAGGVGDAFELPGASGGRDLGIGERDRQRVFDFIAVFGHVIEQRTEPGPASRSRPRSCSPRVSGLARPRPGGADAVRQIEDRRASASGSFRASSLTAWAACVGRRRRATRGHRPRHRLPGAGARARRASR